MKARRNRNNNGYISHYFVARELGVITPHVLYNINSDIDGYGLEPIDKLPPRFVRPSEWLAMPDMTAGDEKVAMLLHIVKGASGNMGATADSNFIAFSMSGPFIVDWGDGTTQAFAAGATAQYAYNFASVSGGTSTETSTGQRQVIVQAYPQSGSPFKRLDLNRIYQGNGVTGLSAFGGGFANPIVHLKVCGATCSYIDTGMGKVFSATDGTTGPIASFPKMRIFEYVGTSGMTNANYLFGGGGNVSNRFPSLCEVRGSEWTANVQQMNGLFQYCNSLVHAPMLNTSNVTTMSAMFDNCASLRYVPPYDTSKVRIMSSMFNNTLSLNGDGLPTFDATRLQTITSMFQGSNIRRFIVPLFKNMSVGLTAGESLGFFFIFNNCNRVVDTGRAFIGCNTSKVTNFNFMHGSALALRFAPNINTSGATGIFSQGMGAMFNNCQSLTWVPPYKIGRCGNTNIMFQNCFGLRYVPAFDMTPGVSNANATMDSMFNNCFSLVSFGDGERMNTQGFTVFSSMFNACRSLQYGPNINLSEATSTSSMFNTCFTLESVPLYQTNKVSNMGSMFLNCHSLTATPDFNTSSAQSLSSMFANCYVLKNALSLSAGTGLTANTSSMYSACYSLSNVSANMNLSNVRNAQNMFNAAALIGLERFPFFDTSKLQNMNGFFTRAIYLPPLDMSGITHNNNTPSFLNNTFLAWGGLSGTRTSISYQGCNLSPTALNDIFQGLSAGRGGLTPGTIRTITITNCWGASGCDRTIATNKGWTVSG